MNSPSVIASATPDVLVRNEGTVFLSDHFKSGH
jgi:hypothetical protein